MIKLKVKDTTIAERDGKTRTGGTWKSREQFAWFETPSGETRKVRVRLDNGQSPYPVGDYTVSDESFVVGEYGDLQMGFALKLEKIPAVARVA